MVFHEVHRMKLAAYLAEKDIGNAEFGVEIGRTAEAVRRYALGLRIPDRKTMPRIVNATGGLVGPADFFEVEAAAA
jgi:hypothetical protein